MFITFEGIEGSGKSSQIQRCEDFFKSQDIAYTLTKEPGGTKLGQTIRQWLLDPESTFHHAYSELLLFIADRCEHAETIIKPALNEGRLLLCDRYKDSTLAYQEAGRQLDPFVINQLNNLVPLDPDLTFLFDCDVEVGLARAKSRAKLDRFEHEDIAFHERIRQRYLRIAKENPNRVIIIDANQSMDDVTEQILGVLKQKLEVFSESNH